MRTGLRKRTCPVFRPSNIGEEDTRRHERIRSRDKKLDSEPSSSLAIIRETLSRLPSDLLPYLYGQESAEHVCAELIDYVQGQPPDRTPPGDLYLWIEVMFSAALLNRWHDYAALSCGERNEAISGVAHALQWNEREFRETKGVRHCSSPGLMCAVAGLGAGNYSTSVSWADWLPVTLLRHFLYGALEPGPTAVLERLVRLRVLICHPVELMPYLLLLWSLEKRTGMRVDLGEIVRAREQSGAGGLESYRPHTWYLEETHIMNTFEWYFEAFDDPDRRAAVVNQLARAWRTLVEGELENATG
jgi:hypothetical protein